MTTTTTPQSPSTPSPSNQGVPLAVWPVAQTTAQWQRAGRYLPDCARHPGKMLPELARRIIAEYCEPGGLRRRKANDERFSRSDVQKEGPDPCSIGDACPVVGCP